jgi:thymidylate synthase (FAD)
MEVKVLRQTEQPERLVCQSARGDYFDGYVGDTEYAELMQGVDYDEHDLDGIIGPDWMEADIRSYRNGDESRLLQQTATEARTLSFIESQLGRGHYGPWEHPHITFTVEGVSRVTMAQITRHRHMSFDVQSQRYVDFSDTNAVVPATLLDDDARHRNYPHVYDEDGEHFNRDEGHFEMDEQSRSHWRNAYKSLTAQALDFYEDAVSAGIPKEDARFILPVGTPVNMTFSGNARTFLHLLDMRRKLNAQWEIRELSELLLEELFDWMPYTFEYYRDHGPNKLSP